MKKTAIVLFLLSSAFAGEKKSAIQLVEFANSHSPELQQAITDAFDTKSLKEGTAWAGRGRDFFFAIESATEPKLVIDDVNGPIMQQVSNSQVWYATEHIGPPGTLHS